MDSGKTATGLSEAMDLHQTHSFEWPRSGRPPTPVTCYKAGTIEHKAGKKHRKRPFSDLISVNVETNVAKVLKKLTISQCLQKMPAYTGENVNEALTPRILRDNSALCNGATRSKTEMSNLADDLDDDYTVQNENRRPAWDENQTPQSAKPSAAKETMFNQSPNSERMERESSVTSMKTCRQPSIQELLPVKYKNRQRQISEKLKDLSSSICQVRVNGLPKGTGFVLFDRFVLTNAHVVKDAHDLRVTVNFSSVYQSEGVQDSGAEIRVVDIVGMDYFQDESGHEHDWALLRLSGDHKLHGGLLPQFDFCPSSGEIYIIGHPDGGVKCSLIILPKDRRQFMERHLQSPADQFSDKISEIAQRSDVITYEACFSHGSSGSPVFNEFCRVVAMHSGGFVEYLEGGAEVSALHFSYPLSSVIERIIVQMVQKGKFDVLKRFLACKFSRHKDMMTNVKKLVESRNYTTFREALSISWNDNDKCLKSFFEFISHKEEPVPMDTDNV